MKKIERYLSRQIISATLLTFLLLISLAAFIKFIEQLRSVGQGDYNCWRAGWYTLLTIPEDSKLLFPFSALLGVLLGLGILASRGELIAMQALGYSRWRIMAAVSKALLPLIIIAMCLGEWINPWSDQIARQFRAQAIEGGSLLTIRGKIWIKDGSDFVYIERITPLQELQGIYIYHFNTQLQLTAITQAQRATFHKDHWELHHCVKQYITLGQPIKFEHKLIQRWPLLLTPQKLGMTSLEPNQLSIFRLHQYIQYLKISGQETNAYELACWKKLISPLSTLSMALLALSSLLGPLRQISVGLRIVIGIITGFVFHIISELASHLSIVYHCPPFLGASAPLMIFSILSIIFFRYFW